MSEVITTGTDAIRQMLRVANLDRTGEERFRI